MHRLSNFRRLAISLIGTLLPILFAMASGHADDKAFTIVIDAGHGGADAGATGAYSKEKDINLKVALELGRLLKRNSPEVNVVYTRRTDVFIPLQTRADIANRNKADLFISIHTNALPKGRIAYGSETYTLGMARAAANLEVAKRENAVITYEKNYKQTYEGFDPNKAESYIIFELMQDRYMKQSVELARAVQQQYVRNGRKNKGVHQAGFLVLRKTSMPAILTELGFISTPEEEAYLNSDKGVKTLALSIYNGIAKYRNSNAASAALSMSPIIPEDPIDKDAAGEKAVVAVAKPVLPAMTDDDGTNNSRKPASDQAQPSVMPVETTDKPQLADASADRSHQTAAKRTNEPKKASTEENAGTATKNAAASKQQQAPQASADKKTPQAKTTKSAVPATKADGTANRKPATADTSGRPVFRVQIFVSDKRLKTTDSRFKGLSPVDSYTDGGSIKYTYGESTSYAEIRKVQKGIADKFPGTFIVAFVNGKRTNLAEAISLSRQKQ